MIIEQKVEGFKEKFYAIEKEIGRIIVGQNRVVRQTLTALISGGHVLLEGVPGLGKTLLVKTLGEVLDLSFSRIQFTPDLMPADITGTNLVMEDELRKKAFQFQPGPVFANLVLADEINRATPKTQSALLESMQEHAVTNMGKKYPLPEPFMVLATQNPIEMEGTYPLPEAQVDRFLFKVIVDFPSLDEVSLILDRTTGINSAKAEKVLSSQDIFSLRELSKEVLMSTHVRDYISRLIIASHPNNELSASSCRTYVRYGSSPRGAQAIAAASRVNALMEGRFNVSFDDVKSVIHCSLRHRLILNFEAQAKGISPDSILDELINEVSYDKSKQ